MRPVYLHSPACYLFCCSHFTAENFKHAFCLFNFLRGQFFFVFFVFFKFYLTFDFSVVSTLSGVERKYKTLGGSSCHASVEMNPTSIHEDAGWIPGIAQWVKGSGVVGSCGVGRRRGSDRHCCGCGVGRQLWLPFDP